ncbi:MAG TPA: LysR family transcriptional regulator [Candidatus Corynebacterium avicola]|uniref:LysR family transcriptional regulator n=1 Tax=Candidatus Corynebacterium avicola TaxID=2838527 RepID=A0A9D1RMV7_9CORY|nr:LysR family transcriptional regulator [Candidatus Corynebacterium avicola]
MIEFRHLEVLREFAARGSVTAVAQATHRTPSAVSQQLKAAERAAGVPLFTTVGRGLRLTDAGQLLASGGVDVATALERVRASWDDYVSTPSGTVRVAGFPSAASVLMPGVLADPSITDAGGIDVILTDIDPAERDFAALTVDHDLVLAHSTSGGPPTGSEELIVVPLGRERLDIAMPATHPLASQEAVNPEDVIQLGWIGVPRGYPFDILLESIAHHTGVEPSVLQRVKDNRLVEAIVAASATRTDGGCLAILPRWSSTTDAQIALRPLIGINAVRDVFAVMRPEKAQRRAVQKVLRLLIDHTPEDDHAP